MYSPIEQFDPEMYRDGFLNPQARQEFKKTPREEMPFDEYFSLVVASPTIAQLAHQRVHTAITQHAIFDGVSVENNTLEKIIRYFNAASKRLPLRNRMLVLSGDREKTQSLTERIRTGVEKYTQTPNGALYALKDCPVREEPLHLIPESLRPGIENAYGIHIEGNLCPQCKMKYKTDIDDIGKIEKAQVERVTFSKKDERGIHTVDFGKAYNFNGAFHKANRGILELSGLLRPEKALRYLRYSFLTATEEQTVKIPRFGLMGIDQAFIVHASEKELEAFVVAPRNEALQDRISVIPC